VNHNTLGPINVMETPVMIAVYGFVLQYRKAATRTSATSPYSCSASVMTSPHIAIVLTIKRMP
jgi:hypothetical protein